MRDYKLKLRDLHASHTLVFLGGTVYWIRGCHATGSLQKVFFEEGEKAIAQRGNAIRTIINEKERRR